MLDSMYGFVVPNNDFNTTLLPFTRELKYLAKDFNISLSLILILIKLKKRVKSKIYAAFGELRERETKLLDILH